MDISNAQRARVLVHALPYIQDYSGKIVVVKYGGNAMVSEHLKDSVIRDICLLQLIGVKVVLVHGGGPEITETLGKMGKQSTFVDGVRVTDEEAVSVALMVLAGKINKTLVNLIELKGGSAIGLSGLDGHMLKATVKKPELGYVGEITDVNVQPILDVIDKGYIPVAPHLLFPQFLDDADPDERELGIFFGNAIMSKCSEVWVFGSRISAGMQAEIRRAKWKNYRLRYFTEDCQEV